MRRYRAALLLGALIIATGALLGKLRRPSAAAGPRCLVVLPPHANHGLNNQLTGIWRAAAVAVQLGCRLAPPRIAARGAGREVPLDAFFEDRGGATVARGPHLAPVGADREAAPRPCLVSRSAVRDGKLNATRQPGCSAAFVLGDWLTHPPDPPDVPARQPSRRTRARELWDAAVGLVRVPEPFTLNTSCGLELAVARALLPRDDLLRAAKWLLWNVVLADKPLSPKGAMDLLRRTPILPALDSPEYTRFPGGVSAPLLVTAHVRGSHDRSMLCRHRMRFALCGTTSGKAAAFLAAHVNSTGCARGPVRLLVGGETVGRTKRLDLPDSVTLQRGLAGLNASACPPKVLLTGRDLAPIYRSLLSHPSLATIAYPADPDTHAEIASVLLDELLLACGDLLPGGTFFQTYISTVSSRAWLLGAAVGARLCLPAGAPPREVGPGITPEEGAALADAARLAGVDFRREFSAPGNVTRRTFSLRELANGCWLKGSFLPSLTFAERDALRDPEGRCRLCVGAPRW